jgi:hypothetical protein
LVDDVLVVVVRAVVVVDDEVLVLVGGDLDAIAGLLQETARRLGRIELGGAVLVGTALGQSLTGLQAHT